MAVGGVSGVGNSVLQGSRNTIAENFDTFLQLLTTQLKNQNPLDPLDTNEFTQQLVQFTSVEQQLKTNEFLEAMLTAQTTAASNQAVSYIGKMVTASGAKAELADGEAHWQFYLDDAATAVNVTVRDANGNIVYKETGALPAGASQFTWDGIGNQGETYPEGAYSITVEARNEAGGLVPVRTEIGGMVTAVDLTGSEPVLIVGNSRINLSMVTSVTLPQPEEPPAETPEEPAA
jgi:flagellar basal-body rod modification protein FlgD